MPCIRLSTSWQSTSTCCCVTEQVNRELPHLASLHSVSGTATLLLTAATALGGALAFGKVGLLQWVPSEHRQHVKEHHKKVAADKLHPPHDCQT